MGLISRPSHLNLLAPVQGHTGLQSPAAELLVLAAQEGHVRAAEVPVGSHTEGEAPQNGPGGGRRYLASEPRPH